MEDCICTKIRIIGQGRAPRVKVIVRNEACRAEQGVCRAGTYYELEAEKTINNGLADLDHPSKQMATADSKTIGQESSSPIVGPSSTSIVDTPGRLNAVNSNSVWYNFSHKYSLDQGLVSNKINAILASAPTPTTNWAEKYGNSETMRDFGSLAPSQTNLPSVFARSKKGIKATPPHPPTSFLRLPAEIRNEIYSYLFEAAPFNDHRITALTKPSSFLPPLFFVNRQLRLETPTDTWFLNAHFYQDDPCVCNAKTAERMRVHYREMLYLYTSEEAIRTLAWWRHRGAFGTLRLRKSYAWAQERFRQLPVEWVEPSWYGRNVAKFWGTTGPWVPNPRFGHLQMS